MNECQAAISPKQQFLTQLASMLVQSVLAQLKALHNLPIQLDR